MKNDTNQRTAGSSRARLIVSASFLLLTAASVLGAPRASAREIRIAFIAYQNPDQLIEDVRPVVAYLSKELGRALGEEVTIKDFVATDYSAIVEALRNETADMGFMGPLQYVMAHHFAGAYPILGEVYNGKPNYVSRIFVRKDSGLKKLEDLRGKTMAFVDPISSSGYMYPLDIFRQAKLIDDGPEKFFKRTYFSGGDEQAIRAVYNKFVDAAGIGQYAFNLLRPDERDAVIAIAESDPIPSHCVVVRKGLDPRVAEALQSALLAIAEGPDRGLLQYLYNVDGYVKVTHEDFKSVERLARSFGFLKGVAKK